MLFRKRKKKGTSIADLEKKSAKQKATSKPYQEKELHPALATAGIFVRTLFWLFMAVLFVYGVYQWTISKQPKVVENIVRYEISVVEGEKAKALAQNFVEQFLTYGTDSDTEYLERTSDYLASSIRLGKPNYANGQSEVLNTTVWDVKKLDENNSDIIVRADVLITNKNKLVEVYNSSGNKVKVASEEQKAMYISVPIGTDGDSVLINDYPTFIPEPELAEVRLETYSEGSSVGDKTRKEILKVLEDYFRVYYGGTKGQLKYFFKQSDNQKIECLEGFTFNRIVSSSAREDDSKVTIIAVIEIEQDLGSLFNQRFLIELEKIKEKWLITKLNNRGA